MEIADARAHLALQYVATVSDNGHILTVQEFTAFVNSPERLSEGPTQGWMSQVLTMQQLFASTLGTRTSESWLSYMKRLSWLQIANGNVTITSLGRAVLRSLERQAIDDDVPVAVVLHDELSYARVIGMIANAGPAALIEPYFSLDQLLAVVQQTEVDRVLTHPDKPSGKGRIAALAQGLAAINSTRTFEIRCSDAFHDRFLIPSGGPIRSIGSSLNHVGRRFSVAVEVADGQVAQAIRKVFEDTWAVATLVQAPALAQPRVPAQIGGGGTRRGTGGTKTKPAAKAKAKTATRTKPKAATKAKAKPATRRRQKPTH